MRGVLLLVAILLAVVSVPTLVHYSADLTVARGRVSSGSRLIQTRCGAIEYADSGSGKPLLMIHGAGGGFDQGMAFGRPLIAAGIRVIAPSRFGYLRTPVPQDVSPEAQADAYVCLLDELMLDRVAVLGASAGAPSAMQFCIRHADRCSSLIVMVPAAYSPAHEQKTMETSSALQFVFDHVLGSDQVLWLVTRLRPELLVRTMLATPSDVFEAASPEERARAIRILDEVQPVSLRREGLKVDARVTNRLPRFELERITAPALMISVEDDLFGTYENARYTAEQVRGARFVSYPSGGHIWLGHDDEVHREVAEFVTQPRR